VVSSAFDSAWKQILTSDTSPQAQELATVFSDKERLDAWDMSSLHKIVFKLSCRNLQEKLQEVQLNLNAPDANGRTPLWWAAARGDKDAVKTLLDHGADIDISDCEGDPPLHAAMFSTQRQDVVNLLLEYGASTTQRNKRGCMTLHHAAHHHNDISYVMPLIRPDMDINTRAGPFGETPLAIASRKDHFRVVKYLLDHGADVNLANKEDNTPLMECVYFGRHRTLSILLSHGAALTPKTKRGETILHMAALYCDKETLDLLASYNAACIVDLKAKTKAGLTVFDLVARRVWLNGEREAFIKLLLTNSSARSTFDEGFLEGWPHPTRSLESGQLGQRRECIEDDTEEEWYDC
jgi:ankyrin repeat protein